MLTTDVRRGLWFIETMEVRRATAEDISAIVEMGGRFVAKAWEIPYDPDEAAAFVAHLVEHGAVTPGAMRGATVTPLYSNPTLPSRSRASISDGAKNGAPVCRCSGPMRNGRGTRARR